MRRKRCCFLNNCANYSSQKISVFEFPFRNPELLQQWIDTIPKDLVTCLEEDPSYICEHHFEKQFVQINNGKKSLHPKAVPTIFVSSGNAKSIQLKKQTSHEYNCRFCLTKFAEDDARILINSYIQRQFFAITQSFLIESPVYSSEICEKCFKSTRQFDSFRIQLISNQNKLVDSLNDVDDTSEDLQVKSEPDEENTNIDQLWEPIEQEHIELSIQEYELNESFTPREESLEPDPVEPKKFEYENETKAKKLKIKCDRQRLCSDCGKTYGWTAYKRHYERVHLKQKNFRCDYCNYASYCRSHIEIHLKSHLKIRDHCCSICGSLFVSNSILKQHFLTHSDIRNWICEIANCGMAFKTTYALRRHEKNHSDANQRFSCDSSGCTAKFKDRWHLNRHQKIHFTKSHPCPTCNKIFGTKDRLKAHQIYHSQPQFSCNLCSKAFFKKPDLASHLKTHSGSKEYKCQYCTNAYFTKAHLLRHQKQIHENLND